MHARTTGDSLSTPRWNRRQWLTAALLSGVGLDLGRGAIGADGAAEEVAQVEAQARKAGLGPFRSSTSDPYLGIGDAPDPYRNEALKRCRALALAYQKHFQDKGFAVAFPDRRLTVVALKDRKTYAAFLGEKPGAAVGGHYDLESNQLVIFDFRPGGVEVAAGAANLERINSFTLIHEATHQLTYNTGLLDRQGDVPLAVSEGLATYAELWLPNGRSVLGAINRPRLKILIQQANQADAWIPLVQLVTEDRVFDDKATEQLAYAESWVLVHYLLKTPEMLPKFRAYLETIRPRRDPSERIGDAKARLGDLDRLDLSLRKHAARIIRG